MDFAPHRDLLLRLAGRYIWWRTPEESLRWPEYIVARAMRYEVEADHEAIERELGPDVLRHILAVAEMGWFPQHRWEYWHQRLGVESVPPLPVRVIPSGQ